jgi:cytochrome c oxidase subunit 2
MHNRVVILLLLVFLGGCGGQAGQSFSLFFQPYSSGLDPRAQETVQTAATYAKAHPLMPISIAGYSDPGNPADDFDTLWNQRSEAVQDALVRQGVGPMRIEVLGKGILYPDGLPNLPVRRVDINIGL